MVSHPDIHDIPRFDQPPPDAQPRSGQFVTPAVAPERRSGLLGRQGVLGRRGFLAVLSTGAMTLGLTVLGWIPLARPARAETGTEYPTCGVYSDGPGGPLCYGAPYSSRYCGSDDWFKTGCYQTQNSGEVCFQPARYCRAAGRDGEARNAWRWVAEGVVYRCADGKVHYEGAPNPEVVICLAQLSSGPPEPPTPEPPQPSPTPSPTPPPPSPTPRPPWPRPPSAEPILPLPRLPQLPLLPPSS